MLATYGVLATEETLAIQDLRGTLKVVGNEKEGGSGRWQTIGIDLEPQRWMFFWLLILLSSF